MRYHRIPDESIRRLPVYLRGLLLLAEQGAENVSSRVLAERVHLNPHQIRKDFSYFGAFGTPGVGYNVASLARQIRGILKLNVTRRAALVGAGKIGSALLGYRGFKMYGFEITAVFDNDPRKIGKKIASVAIEDTAGLRSLAKRGINLAIIAVPAEAAQAVADTLVRAGIQGILNFAPRYISVPRNVKVVSIDIAMDFARLVYYLPAG
jgi:redox-sensing transcriptional repressor